MTADAANLSLTLARFAAGAAFLYLAIGFVFALYFLLGGGLAKLDPVARAGTWGFRLLIIPGVMALWPCLLRIAHRRGHEQSAGHSVESA